MRFKMGQRVKLNRDLEMSGFSIDRNTQGTVSNVHLQTEVLFDDFDGPVAVANSDLESVGAAPPHAHAAAAALASVTVGQRVKLLVQKALGGQVLPAGSTGTVTQDASSVASAWVLFDGFTNDVLIPTDDLAAA